VWAEALLTLQLAIAPPLNGQRVTQRVSFGQLFLVYSAETWSDGASTEFFLWKSTEGGRWPAGGESNSRMTNRAVRIVMKVAVEPLAYTLIDRYLQNHSRFAARLFRWTITLAHVAITAWNVWYGLKVHVVTEGG